MNRRIIIALLLLVLAIPLAGGEVFNIPLLCPLCGKPFEGAQGDFGPPKAGIDSDFCSYSEGGSARAFEVQFCPFCGYCDTTTTILANESLTLEVAEKARKAVVTRLEGRTYPDAETLPIALKFAIALDCAAIRGMNNLALAQLAHLGAWAVRDKITFRTIKPEWKTPLETFEAFDKSIAGFELREPKDFDTAFELLQLSVRLGLPASRDALITRILEAGKKLLTTDQQEQLNTELGRFADDCTQEAVLLARAAGYFELHLSNSPEISDNEKLSITYLLGDIHRRCGRPELAEKSLHAADTAQQRADVRKLIPVLLKHCETAGEEIAYPGYATTICPFCSKRVPILPVAEPDLMGGSDSDFCTYSLDSSCYASDVVCCLSCFYARYRHDFAEPIPLDRFEAVKNALSAYSAIPRPSTPRGLKTWQRYEYASVCMDALGEPPDAIAMSALSAAWAVRRASSSATLEMDIPLEPLLPESALQLARKFDDDTFAGLFSAAVICHRAGVVKQRDKYMKRARKLAFEDAERISMVAATSELFAREQEYLERTIPLLERAIENAQDSDFYLFLLGECHRRTGAVRKSRDYYRRCSDSPRVGVRATKILKEL